MKTSRLLAGAAFASLMVFAACQKSKDIPADSSEQTVNLRPPRQMGPCEPNAYLVTLVSSNNEVATANGTVYEWIWTVQNPAPGNGMNGTTQDMSHWGFPLNACVDATTVVGAAYSTDGTNWNSFTPDIQVDPSQPCMTSPVLKFNYGTSGGAPTYYRVYTSVPYEIDEAAQAYYKSGSNTGCCVFGFDGMGCGGDGGVIR